MYIGLYTYICIYIYFFACVVPTLLPLHTMVYLLATACMPICMCVCACMFVYMCVCLAGMHLYFNRIISMCSSCCKVSICINIVIFTSLLLLLVQFLAFPTRHHTFIHSATPTHGHTISRASPFVCQVSNSFTHLISTIVVVVVVVAAVFTHLLKHFRTISLKR